MVRIGFSKKYYRSEVVQFVKQYGMIFTENSEIIGDNCFIEVETESIKEQGLCCLGQFNDVYFNNNEFLGTAILNTPVSDRIIQLKNDIRNRTMLDADLWISLIQGFVPKFQYAILHRYYYNETSYPLVEVALKQLTIDHLLKMDINQMLLIHS